MILKILKKNSKLAILLIIFSILIAPMPVNLCSSVGANYDEFYLTVSVSPPHGGIVKIVPDSRSYSPGTIVNLTAVTVSTATSPQGFKFDYWSGDANGTNPSIEIIMDSDKEIIAHFIVPDVPILAFDPEKFDFDAVAAGQTIEGTLKVFNRGTGVLEFDIVLPDNFLGAEKDNFQFNLLSGTSSGLDDVVSINFIVDTKGILPGRYMGDLAILSNGGNVEISGRVTIFVPDGDGKPIADFSFSPSTPFANELVIFDASESYDPDGGEIVNYSWSFTDGIISKQKPIIIGYGVNFKYSWEKPGNYLVTLIVVDDEGNSNYVAKQITIKSGAPDDYYTIDISVEPSESGIVELNPSGSQYLAGTEVTLHAIPNEGFYFDHWEGDVSGSSLSITVVMDSSKSIRAVFEEVNSQYLQVSVISPQYNYLYFLGREIPLNLTNTIVPIIIGPVSVEVVIENAVGEVTLELYVDDGDEPKASVTTLESMVSLVWDEKAFLKHIITIVAIDEAANVAADYIDVFIFNSG